MSLTREQKIKKIKILRELKMRECVKSYYAFFCFMWDVLNDENLVANWHIEYLCNELQRRSQYIFDRENKPNDLHINIPPGCSKSSIVTVFWNAWLWLHDPSIVVISSSYSASLSVDHSIKTRDLIRSSKFNNIFNSTGGYFEKTHGRRLEIKKDRDRS